MLSIYRDAVGGWVRLGRSGPGISWTTYPPLFSERMGFRKPFAVLAGRRFFVLPRLV